ncbi:PAS domain-containing protein [uncultured Parvibaculum sp.]|uniref:PAS domain-containing protein n=1 Tax=uncultured Parvibaculum sp. TaxID=291828 RepID=UPI0030DA4DDE
MSSFTSQAAPRRIDTASPVTLLAAPENADAIALHDYWQSKRGERPMPDRADIRPSDFARMLPSLAIIEVIDGGRDFRFRLFGSELANWMGCDRTDQYFSEMLPAPGADITPAQVQQRWTDVARAGLAAAGPLFWKAPVLSAQAVLTMHAVVMPLTAGGCEIAQLFGGAFVTATPASPRS